MKKRKKHMEELKEKIKEILDKLVAGEISHEEATEQLAALSGPPTGGGLPGGGNP